jgi:hypothetical protein
MGISGRRIARLGCARGRARGCSLADVGVASRARHTGRRASGVASHVGIPTTGSRTLTELERTYTGCAAWHARAFMGRAGTVFTSAAGTPFASAAAPRWAHGPGMGSARRSASRAG